MKIKLSKAETALLFTAKFRKVKTDKEFEYFVDSTSDEYILNNYQEITKAYVEIYVQSYDKVYLENMNQVLLDLYSKIEPEGLKSLLEDINTKIDWFGGHSFRQLLFKELYGRLQLIQMMEQDEEGNWHELFELDEAYLEKEM